MAKNRKIKSKDKLFQQHQKFGFDIMEHLAKFLDYAELEKIDKQAVKSVDGCYQKITFPDMSSIRYTTWNRGQPFYIILYKSLLPKEYIFELDLTRLVCIKDKFTWYLAKPVNDKSKKALEKKLNFKQLPSYYIDSVSNQKKTFKQGKRINKKGFLLIENGSWADLLERLATLVQYVSKKQEIAGLADKGK
ncbi:hypothetical protein DKK71_10860 [Snodgrassella alvi]|uniref:hypothetical protein n=1 Tax=Snodgrassella alvi TaxID=1196083 RepID=UPI000D782083|nr:hypothetical protein [Snodgrassella alvi]PXY95788.1 hypothetical protein DKK71_10860 [Snodgrassella alvi]